MYKGEKSRHKVATEAEVVVRRISAHDEGVGVVPALQKIGLALVVAGVNGPEKGVLEVAQIVGGLLSEPVVRLLARMLVHERCRELVAQVCQREAKTQLRQLCPGLQCHGVNVRRYAGKADLVARVVHAGAVGVAEEEGGHVLFRRHAMVERMSEEAKAAEGVERALF